MKKRWKKKKTKSNQKNEGRFENKKQSK